MKLLPWLKNLPKKERYYGLAVAVGLCLIAGIVFHEANRTQTPGEELIVVRTLTIQAAGVSQDYTYAGEVRGRYESQLAFQVNGKIIRRNVNLGGSVSAGDVLMQIDGKDIQQTVNSNSAQVASAESQLKLAENDLARYKQLFDQGAISQSMYEQYANAYNVAVAGLRQALSLQAQGVNQLEYSLLRADNPGVVASITAETGQVVSAGQTVVTVVRDGEREVEISVPENRIEAIRRAKQIKADFWALPGVTANGAIREIAPMADQLTRTFKVRVSLINPPPEIRLGMTAAIHAVDDLAHPAVNIPLAAVYQDGKTPAVWLVKDQALALQPITTGKFGDGTIEVLSGLKAGDCIVTAGVHKLKAGQRVKLGGASL